MSRKLDLIKRIVQEHPVTDPRGAMEAIENVLDSKNPNPVKKPKPLLTLRLEQLANNTVAVAIKCDKDNIKPKHIDMLHSSIDTCAADICSADNTACASDPALPSTATMLRDLFKHFEAKAASANLKKGD